MSVLDAGPFAELIAAADATGEPSSELFNYAGRLDNALEEESRGIYLFVYSDIKKKKEKAGLSISRTAETYRAT